MGTYTSLRCKVKLKGEYIPVIQQLIETKSWYHLGYPFLDEYADYDRSHQIPFNNGIDVSIYWEKDKDWNNRLDEDLWIFQCALKDYENTIAEFFNKVLVHIVKEALHIETFNELHDYSEHYELLDGEVRYSHEGVDYFEATFE